MASSINPYNINGNYPVAGQDNDSQGFRDNFTNIRNNLVFVKTEIEDLQRNALLKTALANTTLDNNLANAELYAPKLRAWIETRAAEPGATGEINIDFNSGNFHHITPIGDVTIADFLNFPNSGYGCVRILFSVTSVAYNVTFPNKGYVGIDDLPGYDSGTRTITFPNTGEFLIEVSTFDRTTYFVRDLVHTT